MKDLKFRCLYTPTKSALFVDKAISCGDNDLRFAISWGEFVHYAFINREEIKRLRKELKKWLKETEE